MGWSDLQISCASFRHFAVTTAGNLHNTKYKFGQVLNLYIHAVVHLNQVLLKKIMFQSLHISCLGTFFNSSYAWKCSYFLLSAMCPLMLCMCVRVFVCFFSSFFCQEYHQSVRQFRSSYGPAFCRA